LQTCSEENICAYLSQALPGRPLVSTQATIVMPVALQDPIAKW